MKPSTYISELSGILETVDSIPDTVSGTSNSITVEPSPVVSRGLSHCLAFLAVLTFLLLVVGGMVRNLGAGLSCPDWPLCFGKIIPPLDIRIFSEWFHRLFAASVSVLTLGCGAWIFARSHLRKKLGSLAGLSMGLLLAQVVLGGLTVLDLLKSEIVTLHLATGTAFFATIAWMALRARTGGDADDSVRTAKLAAVSLRRWAAVAVAALYIQIILGGIVSSHYAGLACPDFPKCLGAWWPGLAGLHGLHFIHRVGAITVFFIIGFLALKFLKKGDLPRTFRRRGAGLAALLCLQISLGIGNVLFRLPLLMSVAHLAVAEALLALLLISSYEVFSLKLR